MNTELENRFLDLMEGDQSNPDVQYELGRCYLYGEGTEQDGQQAQFWLSQAAAQGHPQAQALLNSTKPAKKEVGELTPETLMDWCAAAEDGDPEAQYQVAVYFAREQGDQAEGDILRYLNMAVNQGHPQACLLLGRWIMGQNLPEAERLFHNAADCGIPEAFMLLGEISGKRGDLEKAAEYLEQGAKLGGGEAMLKLAIRFATGDCVPVSQGKAMSWLKRSQDAGLADAQARYHQHLEELRLQQEAEAQQRAEAEARRRAEQQEAQRQAELQRQQQEAQRQAELQRQQALAAQRKLEEQRRTQAEERRRAEADQQAKAQPLRNTTAAAKRGLFGLVRRHPVLSVIAALWLAGWVLNTASKLVAGAAEKTQNVVASVTAQNVDAFADIQLHYTGMAPYGIVDIINNSPYSSLQYASYTAEPSQGLSNGDTVTVTLSYDNGSLLNDNIKVSETTKTYTVEGLDSYVTKSAQLDEASLEAMQSQAADMIETHLTNTPAHNMSDFLTGKWNYGDYHNEFGTPAPETSYLLALKNGFTGDYANMYTLVYKVPAKIVQREVLFDGYAYYAVTFYDLSQSADGVTNVTLSLASLRNPVPSLDTTYANQVSAFKESYSVEELPVQ